MQGRTFLHPSRRPELNRYIYGGTEYNWDDLKRAMDEGWPEKHPYNIYWGEIHGHTELSDGNGTLDEYFTAARDTAELDFCAVTDHDHGGLGHKELWGEKWDQTQDAVARYHDSGRFVTLLGYERDSWPWYSNLCIYYREGRGEMIRGAQDGQITRPELEALLSRPDVIAIPHHTATISQGVNFDAIPLALMAPLIEVYSKWGTSEYFNNPRPVTNEARGGHWHDALERGARIGCVAGSDVHCPHPGVHHRSGGNLRYVEPGLVAVLATELTREAIFDALRARRCYASAGARVAIDFRINHAMMGEELALRNGTERRIYIQIKAKAPLARVDVVKNAADTWVHHADEQDEFELELRLIDLRAERPTDYYYLRVTLADGRQVWSSPIWIDAQE